MVVNLIEEGFMIKPLLEMDIQELASFFGVTADKVAIVKDIPMDTPAMELGME
jgi:hypothetical protein